MLSRPPPGVHFSLDNKISGGIFAFQNIKEIQEPPCRAAQGRRTPVLEVVQHQFKGTGQRLLPLAVVGPNEFFFTVTYSPVGANVNGLGTYALHKNANEYLATNHAL